MKSYIGIPGDQPPHDVDVIEHYGSKENKDVNSYYGLSLYTELVNHSPDGFNWGYEGSGPAQLAFAILMDYTQDEEFTRKHYQKFKEMVIAKLPKDTTWVIQNHDMEFYCQQLQDFDKN